MRSLRWHAWRFTSWLKVPGRLAHGVVSFVDCGRYPNVWIVYHQIAMMERARGLSCASCSRIIVILPTLSLPDIFSLCREFVVVMKITSPAATQPSARARTSQRWSTSVRGRKKSLGAQIPA